MITVGSVFHLGVLNDAGRLGSDAPDLDTSVFGLSSSITPPEAMKLSSDGSNISVNFVDARSTARAGGDGAQRHHKSEKNVATASWDTWCFGAMLFELVTGRKIPAYGSSLSSFLSKYNGGGGDAKTVDVENVLSRYHYDWLKNVGESKHGGALLDDGGNLSNDAYDNESREEDAGQQDTHTKGMFTKPGLLLCSSVLEAVTGHGLEEHSKEIDGDDADSPNITDMNGSGDAHGTEAKCSKTSKSSSSLLSSSALLASISNGFSYRALLPRSAVLDAAGSRGGKQSDQFLEAIRQKWVRLEMGGKGQGDCCSWSELIEKMSRHARGIEREISVSASASASASASTTSTSAGQNKKDKSKKSKGSSKSLPHALSVLRTLDASKRGGLPPSLFVEVLINGTDGIHGNGLNYPLTATEASRLASCATVMVSADGGSSKDEPLVAFEAFAGVFCGYPHGGKFGGKEDPSSLILDILAICLSNGGEERPNAKTLLSHPFFHLTENEEESAQNDCKMYTVGAAPVEVMVNQEVLAPMRKLVKQSAVIALKQQKYDTACSVGATDVGFVGGGGTGGTGGGDGGSIHEASFDVGLFCDVMNSASSFLHGSGSASGKNGAGNGSGHGDGDGDNVGDRVTSSSNWSARERIHAASLMLGSGGLLSDIVACTLRFISCDQSTCVGHDVAGSAGVGGSATASLGQRLMVRVARFFEAVLLETRPIVESYPNTLKDGPASPFVPSVLESLTQLYLGEEGGLARVYGQGEGMKIDYSGPGGSNKSVLDGT